MKVISLFILCGVLSTRGRSADLEIVMADLGSSVAPGALYKLSVHEWDLSRLNTTDIESPYALGYDTTKKYVYWTDLTAKTIRRVNTDSDETELVATLSETAFPEGLAIDNEERLLFYTDSAGNTISKINIETLESEIVLNSDLDKPKGIVVNRKTKKIFWVSGGTSPKIETCDYNGKNKTTLVDTGITVPGGIAIDENAGRIFWTDMAGKIESIQDIDRRVIVNKFGSRFFDVIVFNGYIFYTIYGRPGLYAKPEDSLETVFLTTEVFGNLAGIVAFSEELTREKPCKNGYFGNNCDMCGLCELGFGCEKTTGVCLAGCTQGYKPRFCNESCDIGTFGKHCGSQCSYCKKDTACHPKTGKCVGGCESGWTGPNCTIQCPGNTYGECVPCGHCAGGKRCNNDTGNCPSGLCDDGWSGPRCDGVCPPHHYGKSCLPCGQCANSAECDKITGDCLRGCKPGWIGKKCQTETSGGGGGLSGGAIAGIVLAVLLFIAIVIVCVFIFMRYLRSPKDDMNIGLDSVIKSETGSVSKA